MQGRSEDARFHSWAYKIWIKFPSIEHHAPFSLIKARRIDLIRIQMLSSLLSIVCQLQSPLTPSEFSLPLSLSFYRASTTRTFYINDDICRFEPA